MASPQKVRNAAMQYFENERDNKIAQKSAAMQKDQEYALTVAENHTAVKALINMVIRVCNLHNRLGRTNRVLVVPHSSLMAAFNSARDNGRGPVAGKNDALAAKAAKQEQYLNEVKNMIKGLKSETFAVSSAKSRSVPVGETKRTKREITYAKSEDVTGIAVRTSDLSSLLEDARDLLDRAAKNMVTAKRSRAAITTGEVRVTQYGSGDMKPLLLTDKGKKELQEAIDATRAGRYFEKLGDYTTSKAISAIYRAAYVKDPSFFSTIKKLADRNPKKDGSARTSDRNSYIQLIIAIPPVLTKMVPSPNEKVPKWREEASEAETEELRREAARFARDADHGGYLQQMAVAKYIASKFTRDAKIEKIKASRLDADKEAKEIEKIQRQYNLTNKRFPAVQARPGSVEKRRSDRGLNNETIQKIAYLTEALRPQSKSDRARMGSRSASRSASRSPSRRSSASAEEELEL